MRLTFIHGWGWDASLWDTVKPGLASAGFNATVEFCDLGYFNTAQLPEATPDTPRIVVTHSLAALWWLLRSQLPWHKLVAINGFPRFSAAPDFTFGVAQRVLQRMASQLVSKPDAVMREFHGNCGVRAGQCVPQPPTIKDCAPLITGLHDLLLLDARALWQARAADIWLLWSGQDRIVPRALSDVAAQMLPVTQSHCITEAPHILPISHPNECVQWINTCISELK